MEPETPNVEPEPQSPPEKDGGWLPGIFIRPDPFKWQVREEDEGEFDDDEDDDEDAADGGDE